MNGKSRIMLLAAIVLLCPVAMAQVLAPSLINVEKKAKGRGEDAQGYKVGFFPFSKPGQLAEVYAGKRENSKGVFNELQLTSLSLSLDSIKANAIIVEVASFIPNSSLGRFSIGTQLSQADISRSDSNRSYQNLAVQKMLNGGGNIVVNFLRPLFFNNNETGSRFCYSNLGVSVFADTKRLNQDFYNSGVGAQLTADLDLRLFSNASTRMTGNLFRAGIRGRTLLNAFNVKYSESNEIDEDLRNAFFGSIGGYIGFFIFNIDYVYNFSNTNVFAGRESMFRFSIQPIKF